MKTLTVKLPEEMLTWLEQESKRVNRPKSALVRDILHRHQQARPRTALDMATDLCGSARSGLGDLSRDKKHFKR